MAAFLVGSAFFGKQSATATIAAVSPPASLAYSKTTRIFSATSEPSATITVRRGGIVAGTTTANGIAEWSFTFSMAPPANALPPASQELMVSSENSPSIVVPGDNVALSALGLFSTAFTAGAAAGTVIGAITGRTSGSTVSVAPADTRVAMEGVLYDLTLGLSDCEITASDIRPVSVSLMTGCTIAS